MCFRPTNVIVSLASELWLPDEPVFKQFILQTDFASVGFQGSIFLCMGRTRSPEPKRLRWC